MIYVITHKKFNDSLLDDHYKVLHVGVNDDCKDYYLRDDTGNNISYKNPNFCELTGLYWAWKNGSENDDDICGLVHYRRYFTTKKESELYWKKGVMPSILPYHEIEDKLRTHDMILPVQMRLLIHNVGTAYVKEHNKEDLNILENSIRKVCPNYLQSFNKTIKSKSFYWANMMICKKVLFDEYCAWLFSIMEELEKRIDITKYSNDYQTRVFGFMAERLVKVWVLKNKPSVVEYPIFNTEQRERPYDI